MKTQMVLNKLKTLLPGQEREFLEFMGECSGGEFIDFNKYSLEDLVDMFIDFEESNNEEELNEECLDEVLKIYIPGFKSGEFIF